MEVYSQILILLLWLRSNGVFRGTLVPFKIVPLEKSRSQNIHLLGSDLMERRLEEVLESLIGVLLQRSSRLIQTFDLSQKFRVSPLPIMKSRVTEHFQLAS
ncbi:hypothetical protein ACFXTH_022291 [Malus domestica]